MLYYADCNFIKSDVVEWLEAQTHNLEVPGLSPLSDHELGFPETITG